MPVGSVFGVELWEGFSACFFSLFTASPTTDTSHFWKNGLKAVSRNKTSGVAP